MIPNLTPLKLPARWTLQSLRPPSRRKLLLLEGFSAEGVVNLGCCYRFDLGEQAVAAGAGKVVSIRLVFPTWKYTPGSLLGTRPTYEVTIDHGNDISTTVHGLVLCAVQTGTPVQRGDVLGSLLTGEVLFQVKSSGAPYDPASISRHFQVQDGTHSVGRTGYLREAADMIPRTIYTVMRQIIVGGTHFFANILGHKPPVLVNIDFNGTDGVGRYVGPAAVGGVGDYWNNYAPVAYAKNYRDCYCTYSYAYSGTPEVCFTYSYTSFIYLMDSSQSSTKIWLERIAPLANSSGTTASWNDMLATWIGGFDMLGVPLVSVFRLHGLPPGTYQVYLYSDQTFSASGSDYYVQVDGGAILHAATNPTGAVSWIQDDNYVLFDSLDIVPGSIVRVEALGYLAGLQVRRL